MNRLLVFAPLAMLLGAFPIAPQSEDSYLIVRGVVVTTVGNPITGVLVHGRGQPIKTGDDGSFKVEGRGLAVRFEHPEYRPLNRVFTHDEKNARVVLEDAKSSSWTLPGCSADSVKEKVLGGRIRLTVPVGIRVEVSKDIDYVQYFIFPHEGTPKEWLGIMVGPFAASGEPNEKWVLASTEVSERWVKTKSNSVYAFDVRGRLKDRTFWRELHVLGDMSAIYNGASDASVMLFDKIIDSACSAER